MDVPKQAGAGMRCHAVLVAWLGRNWNVVRLPVDLIAALFPDAVGHAGEVTA